MSDDNVRDTLAWVMFALIVALAMFSLYFLIQALFISPFLVWRDTAQRARMQTASEQRRISTQNVFPLYELACLAANLPISTSLTGPSAAYAYNIKSALADVLLEEAKPKSAEYAVLRLTPREDLIRSFPDDKRINRKQAKRVFEIIGIEVAGITD